MVAVPEVLNQAAAAVPVREGARIDVRHVSHQFALHGAALPVLDDVSFAVEPGEFVALLGPSGCGKSTLLRLVAGLDTPTQGSVQADGAAITGPDPSRVVVFQDPTLYPWRTVRGNVGIGPQAQRKRFARRSGPQEERVQQRIDAALELVGLSDFAEAFPHQLSGGMAQRVALARALVNDPALLVLDEPFGKLDSLTRIRMQGELARLWQDARFSVLLVTHDVEEAGRRAWSPKCATTRRIRAIATIRNWWRCAARCSPSSDSTPEPERIKQSITT
jgi:NitT/TauT family transport system ATP-binding protein